MRRFLGFARALVVILVSSVVSGLVAGGGGAGVIREGPVAVAASPAVADLYDTFLAAGRFSGEAALMKELSARLASEGYRVQVYTPSLAAGGSAGARAEFGPQVAGRTTFARFVGMAQAGVIVLDTHGVDLSKPGGCSQKSGKGLYKEITPVAPPTSGQPDIPVVCVYDRAAVAAAFRQPYLLVAMYTTEAEAFAEYRSAVREFGADPAWLQVIETRDDGLYARPVYGLMISRDGVAHYFSRQGIGIIDAVACHSLSFASAFDALSFYGYIPQTCAPADTIDTKLLWDRLFGSNGVPERTTTAAEAAGGFREDLLLAPGSQPVVLSPAVGSVTPADHSKIASGTSTSVTIKFDAHMVAAGASDVVEASGCGAKVVGGSWSDRSSTLSFELHTKRVESDQHVTLTISPANAQASAARQGENDRLDGNRDPSPQSGEAPNNTSYIWHLTCTGKKPAPQPPPSRTPNPNTPVELTFQGDWTVDENALTKAANQVHGVETESGSWDFVWKGTEQELEPTAQNGPTGGLGNASGAWHGTATEINTNPDSTCDQAGKGNNVGTFILYPAGDGESIAAIQLPPFVAGLLPVGDPWVVVSGCKGVRPGVGWGGPGSTGGPPLHLLGKATYSPDVNIPAKYIPTTDAQLQTEHWQYAVFLIHQKRTTETSVPFSYTYTYPYNNETEGDGTLKWEGTVHITTG